ncbi:MAG: REP-associated tyrosine transposase, partial [Panacagrimonas sp.]
VVPCLYDSALIGNSQTLCWVLMPDHLHWLLALGDNTELSRVVGRFKSASAARINLALDRVGVPVWARAYHDHAVRHDEDVETVARYIVGNPLRAGLREDIGHYPHWDAAWDWAW